MSLFKELARYERSSAAPEGRVASAVHSGSMGDILYALPTVRALGAQRLVLNVCVDPAVGNRTLSATSASFLAPLLLEQDGVQEVAVVRAGVELRDSNGHLVAEGIPLERADPAAVGFDHLLDRFRLDPGLATKHLLNSHADAMGVTIDADAAFLTLPDLAERRARAAVSANAPIILSLTPRYRRASTAFFARLLQGIGPIIKVGLPGEADLYHGIPGDFVSATDALELARLIADARLFVGVPSMAYAIAEGLKVPRLVDVSREIPNAWPVGANGWRMPDDLEDARTLLLARLSGEAAGPPVRLVRESHLAVFWRSGDEGFSDACSAQTGFPASLSPGMVSVSLPALGKTPDVVALRVGGEEGWYEISTITLRDADGRVLWRLDGVNSRALGEAGHDTPAVLAAGDGRLFYWYQPAGGAPLQIPLSLAGRVALSGGGRFDVFVRSLSDAEAGLAGAINTCRGELADRMQGLSRDLRGLATLAGVQDKGVRNNQAVVLEVSRAVSRMRDELELSRARIAGFEASTSWRVTSPLRFAVSLPAKLRLAFRGGWRNGVWTLLHAGWRRVPVKAQTRARIGQLVWRYGQPLLQLSPRYRNRMPMPVSQSSLALPPAIPQPRNLTIPGAWTGPSGQPLVSVIIPVYNKLDYTIACLDSIAVHPPAFPFQIVVVDDGSSDETQAVLSARTDILYVRNAENLGFIGSCNAGAAASSGRFLFFLNNDTTVTPGWLDRLVETLRVDPTVGLAGSKLIYPDGRLQEAGGIVFNDADGWNYGRFADPMAPAFNYLRDVDYCSGAAILVGRGLFERLGGFDALYRPAYYEDTDLAFRIREQAGLRSVYQPLSHIFHFEGITSGTDTGSGVKAYQVTNKARFLDRWKSVLATHGDPGEPSRSTLDRRVFGRILVVDACTPTPDRDSGSLDMANLLRILTALGQRVTFVPESNLLHFGHYTEDLQRIGVECLYAPHTLSVEQVLRERGDEFDVVVLTRGPVAIKYAGMVRRLAPHARIIFNTVDLHFLREERQAALEGRTPGEDARQMKQDEMGLIRGSDSTIVVSRFEGEMLSREAPRARIDVIPVIREIPGRAGGYRGRNGIVFIGGFLHPPNADAVQFFLAEVWPLVRADLPDATFRIIGSHMPDSIRALAGEGVEVLGFVEDLDPVFNHCLMTVAPLRYGAGIKGKVATSLGYGVPCVATTIAVEGTGMENDREVLVADQPAAMAAAIVRLAREEELWDRLSRAGLAFCRDYFALPPNLLKVANMLAGISRLDGIHGRGAALVNAMPDDEDSPVWTPDLSERTRREAPDLGPWMTGWEALATPRDLVVLDRLPTDPQAIQTHLARAIEGVASGGWLLFAAIEEKPVPGEDGQDIASLLRRAGFEMRSMAMGSGSPFLWVARRLPD